MTQNNVYISDVEDATSETTVDSEDEYVGSSVAAQSQYQNHLNDSRITANNINVPAINVPDKSPISHISSVALQNSTDITFGNKTLYNGPITVNQYGIADPCRTSDLSNKSLLFLNRWKILLISAIIVIIIIPIATILTLHFKNGETDTYEIDDSPLTLVTREKWLAKPPTGDIDDLMTPVPLVVIQHTVQSTCDTKETCALLVRQIQTQHMNSPLIGDDIGYNFLVGGDGAAYEGRGWNEVGAHTKGYNSRSIGVAFIGDFTKEKPPKQQVIALLKLLRDGVEERKISENYTLIGANQVQQTESPGIHLFKILTRLEHWSDQI
ncbi:peptidoglycan recognition protein-like isoform X1 [Bradysia coprophila]|uniref:peptidoglycan recognition protein-like isoform X1 n=1 Tax=Bradysia coprophila TaxID=38358 RepID=UPI00187D7DB3|nr:peptidoglycan recognition protein-like isoform X1 [Bradysia coprophila]